MFVSCPVFRKVLCILAFAGLALVAPAERSEAARITAKVDLSAKTMKVYRDGRLMHSWRVSTGRRGYRTPTGTYRPKWLKRMHYSTKYDYSPMPYSVFFHRGYAIHGTNYVSRLGRPASHGCVRLHPRNAARLFSLIRANGRSNTRIIIRW
ncbi:MAG: L,D-transpeptidase [Hyphomicrobiales bacterium]